MKTNLATENTEKKLPHFQGVVCQICSETFTREELDRSHWCAECRALTLKRMRVWRHVFALAVALPVGIWVFLHPAFDRWPAGLWALLVIATYYFGFRLGKEVVTVYTRLKGA